MSKVIAAINKFCEATPNKIALSNGSGKEISYQNLQNEIDKIAKILTTKKLSSLAILSDNSPAWIAFDLACLKAKITITPLPHFFTKEQVLNAILESKIETILCDNPENLSYLNFDKESFKIFNDEFFLLKLSEKSQVKTYHKDTLKITYTSGSSGNPKGVCLGITQIENVVFALAENLKSENLQSNLSILPLSVLLENIAGVYVILMLGAKAIIPSLKDVGMSGSSSLDVEKFSAAINQFQPSSMILVPELAKLLLLLTSAKKIQNPNFKFIAIGGAKVAPDLLNKAQELNLPFFQGYGLSEFSSVVALNNSAQNKIGSVGKILPHILLKISPENEILLKGNLALGYSSNKDLELEDAWYKTGDVGHIDDDGFLFIDGRKKNIFITSFGRNINPEWLESELLKSPQILQAAVFGEEMPVNAAVIFSATSLDLLKNEVAKINQNLPDYAQIKKIILAKEPFSQKNKMLTGNGRIRREEVFKFYQKQIKE